VSAGMKQYHSATVPQYHSTTVPTAYVPGLLHSVNSNKH